MKYLSTLANRLVGQPMFQLLVKANELERQGRKILHFEIGQPYFSSPSNVIRSACDALWSRKTGYVSSMGIPELREAVCDTVETDYGFRPTVDQVLITPANAVIYFLIKCVVNPAMEVIYPDPGFPTYYAAILANDAEPVPVSIREENQFRVIPYDIQKAITSNTRLVIINSPSNPTGAVLTKNDIDEIFSIAQERDVYLLSDETYSKILYEGEHYSPCVHDHCKERTILLQSFSKAYSMTGWRLGYAVGPEELISKMGLLLQTIVSCLPPFIQYAGITALKHGASYNRNMVYTLRQRRDEMVSGLNSLPRISCPQPNATFYAFPNITKTGMTSQEFADLMLERAGVALLPGTNFGKHGEGYVRLSYATSKENIRQAIERMKEVLT